MRDEVVALFHAVADLSPEARARYFDEHRVDAELRAEVESLLAHDAPTGSLADPIEREARQFLQSSSFGPYRTIGVLGEGGMGIVYLAEQVEPVRRRVALKVIKHSPAGSLVARFESERQALALLDHPNIAKLYDAGETADGRPWFAMEYVAGLPITDYCDNNQLELRERLLLFQHVCHALEHAHEKGIIHRDLKPSNILVAKVDGAAMPKVIDFGVAKAVNLRLTERTLFTEVGMLIGTPEYMSPEQAGDAEIGSATDIYSLGVVLYELLVGATPFDSKSLRRAGYNEICRIIRETDPPRPGTRLQSLGDTASEVARRRGGSVAALARTLHGDLEWITMKALEKEPGRRYASPGEFAADVERHLRHEPVKARAPSASYRLRKFVRRRRLELIATAAALLTVATGLIGLFWNKLSLGPTTISEHRIELPGSSSNFSWTDGQRTMHWDIEGSGEMVYDDPSRKIHHVILKAGRDDLQDWQPSRDVSRVALLFKRRPDRPAFLTVENSDGSGHRELVRDDDRGTILGQSSTFGQWSWDNRWFLFSGVFQGERRLLAISGIDGTRRVLATWKSGELLGEPAFSPDGRFIAYGVYSEQNGEGTSRIFVAPSQGGESRVVYQEGVNGRVGLAVVGLALLDWTASGRDLLLISARSGKAALHLLPLRDGQRDGDPVFIRNGRFYSAHSVKSGALIYLTQKTGTLRSMYVASVDGLGRPGAWQKLRGVEQNWFSPFPKWSADSNQIVFVAMDVDQGRGGDTVVHVYNVSTAEDREVYRFAGTGTCAWAANARKIFCLLLGPGKVLSISPDTGATEDLGDIGRQAVFVDRVSRNDTALYLLHIQFPERGSGMAYWRWDIAKRQPTVLKPAQAEEAETCDTISPDERWLVRGLRGRLEVKPVSGGGWNQVVSSDSFGCTFSADSQWLYYAGRSAVGGEGLFRVAIQGGNAEPIGGLPDNQPNLGDIQISPDGHKVVIATYNMQHGYETWSLEHFIPSQAGR